MVMNKHLLCYMYMVGDHITLADISLCCALVEAFKSVLTPDIKKEFTNLVRWFDLCMAQVEFVSVLGKLDTSKAPAPKKEQPAKKEAAPKKETAPKKEPAPKKES